MRYQFTLSSCRCRLNGKQVPFKPIPEYDLDAGFDDVWRNLSRQTTFTLPGGCTVRNELRAGDIGFITYLHGILYAREQGWDSTFEAYVAGALSEFAMAKSLLAARLYRSFGFEKTAEETHEIWGARVTEETL